MLTIKQPYIKENRLYFEVIEKDEKKNVWFEVPQEYAKYLCDERCDAILIGLLNYAMRKNLNIKCEGAVTEELLYNINTYLIPAISRSDKNLNPIKIDAKIAPAIENAGGVGTGLSCGIDSFHAILSNLDSPYKSLNLTHLCINNVGAFNDCYKFADVDDVIKERYKQSKIVADKFNLPLIMTNSNFATEFVQNHLLTNTYSSMFAVFCMQKLWKTYYYASVGKSFEGFKLKNNSIEDSANYDLLTLNCFSHKNLRLYSEGGAINRLEKTQEIVDNEIVQNHLYVCIKDINNCGVCHKCKRTLLSLDVLNKLDEFKNVFNVEYYKKHKLKYYAYLYNEHLKKNKMIEPIYNKLSNKVPFLLKSILFIFFVLKTITKPIFKIFKKKKK